jgi:hypothetical protein
VLADDHDAFLGIARLPDDLEVVFQRQDRLQPVAEQRVVVDQDDRDPLVGPTGADLLLPSPVPEVPRLSAAASLLCATGQGKQIASGTGRGPGGKFRKVRLITAGQG